MLTTLRILPVHPTVPLRRSPSQGMYHSHLVPHYNDRVVMHSPPTVNNSKLFIAKIFFSQKFQNLTQNLLLHAQCLDGVLLSKHCVCQLMWISNTPHSAFLVILWPSMFDNGSSI